MMHLLFSYGTLQLEQVQLDTYDRLLFGTSDQLPNYRIEQLEITDPDVLTSSKQQYHPIAIKTNNPSDSVEGMVFKITDEELAFTDRYEVDDYIRIEATLASGNKAWVYVSKN
jgi:gamma-glutamylcyclotransferase (GGCT)/AIG2-like uncharacterized protein YtfP